MKHQEERERETCERGADEISYSLHEQQKSVSVGESLERDEFDEDDGGERVVGSDEQAESTGDDAEHLVRPDERDESDDCAAQRHGESIDQASVHPHTVTGPAQYDLLTNNQDHSKTITMHLNNILPSTLIQYCLMQLLS